MDDFFGCCIDFGIGLCFGVCFEGLYVVVGVVI